MGKIISLQEAANLVKDGDTISICGMTFEYKS